MKYQNSKIDNIKKSTTHSSGQRLKQKQSTYKKVKQQRKWQMNREPLTQPVETQQTPMKYTTQHKPTKPITRELRENSQKRKIQRPKHIIESKKLVKQKERQMD